MPCPRSRPPPRRARHTLPSVRSRVPSTAQALRHLVATSQRVGQVACGAGSTCSPRAHVQLPAKHAVHCPPSGPVYPALHRHWVLPGSELERFPAGHSRHTEAPLTFRYVPAAHNTHSVDPFTVL
eukprot:333084-Rhodomonas_salina.3